MTPRIWNFPTFPIAKQLFHVPGAANEGGFTSGGARIMSPEPGGFSMLEIQPSLQVTEWDFPLSSWLMSKTNGQVLRVRLAPTPQVASARSAGVPWGAEGVYPESPWSNMQNWSGDVTAVFAADALEGSNIVRIGMGGLGELLRHGHVIGAGDVTYKVDDIEYVGTTAIVTVIPPIRKAIKAADPAFFRPWFLGTISNGADFRTTYDAENNGNIQIGKIILNEVIMP